MWDSHPNKSAQDPWCGSPAPCLCLVYSCSHEQETKPVMLHVPHHGLHVCGPHQSEPQKTNIYLPWCYSAVTSFLVCTGCWYEAAVMLPFRMWRDNGEPAACGPYPTMKRSLPPCPLVASFLHFSCTEHKARTIHTQKENRIQAKKKSARREKILFYKKDYRIWSRIWPKWRQPKTLGYAFYL